MNFNNQKPNSWNLGNSLAWNNTVDLVDTTTLVNLNTQWNMDLDTQMGEIEEFMEVDDDDEEHTRTSFSVPSLLRTVKDKPVLCDKACLDLPFMRLPNDIILHILARLPVDVLKLGSLCMELSYLTSNDDLWKQKFVQQFGHTKISEGETNWKDKFAQAFASGKGKRHPYLKRKRIGYLIP